MNEIQYPLMIQTLNKLGIEGNILNQIKIISEKKKKENKTIANIIINGERLNYFSLRSGMRQVCLLSQLLWKIVLSLLVTAIWQGKEIENL